jgi:hypothetical protein
MATNWQGVPYDEIEVPEPLYKFREWPKRYHKTILTEQELHLSAPSSFEDPKDCKNPVRFDLHTHREQNKRFFEESVRRHPHWSKSQHKRWAKRWMKRTPIRNPKKYEQMVRVTDMEFDKVFGVCSLTPEVENFEMWEKYADNHKGFCVGFAGKELLRDESRFGMTGHVDYCQKLPIIRPEYDNSTKGMMRAFPKLEKWAFEKEYRTTKIKPHGEVGEDWRKVKVPNEKFVEIIFGAHMAEEHKQEITEIAKTKFPNVKFRQAEIDSKKKTVTINDLE